MNLGVLIACQVEYIIVASKKQTFFKVVLFGVVGFFPFFLCFHRFS